MISFPILENQSCLSMKFPSLNHLAQTVAGVFKRFPFEILSALIGTIAATINIELRYIYRPSETIYIRLMMAAEISLLLSFAATLHAESKNLNLAKKLILRLAGIFLAVILFFLIRPAERQSDYIRFFLLILSFHLLVAFAAFTGKNQVHGFWQFNKTLFLRILTAALYSIVLFLGIAAAISAMNFLFGFKFEWDTYWILWFWIAGIFNTAFFLAGVPENFDALKQDYSYPKGLKLFTQYVLIPLASVYVLILLSYEIKILLERNLPRGLVSNLILGYAVFGILSLLLVYPIRNLDENKWLKSYSRYFYFLLIPLLVLLFVAVGTRVFKYGITENRYFLIVLAIWLFLITLYFLISKKQNIKLIPISLCALTLLAVYGPQSAFAVAEVSQRQILFGIFKKYNAVFNGKLSKISEKVSTRDGNRAVATLQYLVRNHDLASVQTLFSKNLNAVADSLSKEKNKENNLKINNWELKERKLDWAKAQLGLTKFTSYDDEYGNTNGTNTEFVKTYYIFPDKQQLTVVKGYDYLINANYAQDSLKLTVGTDHFLAVQSFQTHQHLLKINQLEFNFEVDTLLKKISDPEFNLQKYAQSATVALPDSYYVPASHLSVIKTLGNFTVNFQINNLSYSKNNKGKFNIQNVQGDYLIKKNN
ncbi:MAG: DUF4153 domain-containing protein [Sphingobacteriaceae bacterium]|nr:MAG: DUF4153 domain-containing protein [Sphingobacteriaceae bacterium]